MLHSSALQMPALAYEGCLLQVPVSGDERNGVLICGILSPSIFSFYSSTSNVHLSQSTQIYICFFLFPACLSSFQTCFGGHKQVCVQPLTRNHSQHCDRAVILNIASKWWNLETKVDSAQFQDNEHAFAHYILYHSLLLNIPPQP